jgi:nucleoside-diphosphate-sugar epimerase
MKVFLTGGTGFLGRRVARKLLSEGHSVRCLVRPASDVDALYESLGDTTVARLEIVHGQLSRIGPEYFEGCDALCHVAAAMKGSTAAMFVDNVIATRRLLKAAHAAELSRVVLVSSLAVYGTSQLRPGDVLDETCPLDAQAHLRDPYTYSKLAAELVAWELHAAGRCPLVVVRPGVIYGPGRDPLSTRVGLRLGRLLVRMGSGQLLPYVEVEACAAGVAQALTTPGIEGEAFNLLDAELMKAGKFLKLYRRKRRGLCVIPVPHFAIGTLSRLNLWYHRWSGGQIPAVLTPYKSDSFWKRLRYSNSKVTAVLNWKPCPSTADAISALLQLQDSPCKSEWSPRRAAGLV